MSDVILSIDQGTTSSRAICFDANGDRLTSAQTEFEQHFPQDGWVEHEPEVIWRSVLQVSNEALGAAIAAGHHIVALGITNQRETTLVWDRRDGRAIYNAIVWQDRRTAAECEQLRAAGHEKMVSEKTGLLLDPYFSATKLAWILDNVSGARRLANAGHLAFGTVDSFLLWRLTNGHVHATDATNASRTLLYNIHENAWDSDLLRIFNIPQSCLPEVRDSATDFGLTATGVFNMQIPIAGIAGDQQAAAIGQGCFDPGQIKSTYGTGCFVLSNTGSVVVRSEHRLLSTIAYRLNGETSYALEGSIFVAGAAVQWLRDKLNLFDDSEQTEAMARALEGNEGVYVVPAFTGLGAPHWSPHARGAIFGLTRDTDATHLVRATLESIAYQTHDLMQSIIQDAIQPPRLRIDGGMANNNWFCQFLCDVLGMPVERPRVVETTALGAAYLAGLGCGLFESPQTIQQRWRIDRTFVPQMAADTRSNLLTRWRRYVDFIASDDARP